MKMGKISTIILILLVGFSLGYFFVKFQINNAIVSNVIKEYDLGLEQQNEQIEELKTKLEEQEIQRMLGEEQKNIRKELSDINIEKIQLRVNDINSNRPYKSKDVEYFEGNDYKYDMAIAKGNLAAIRISLKNTGSKAIKNLKVKYQCMDETVYRMHTMGNELFSSHNFQGNSLILPTDESDAQSIDLFPIGEYASFQLYLTPLVLKDKNYHIFNCDITFTSVENELRKDGSIKNYWLKKEDIY